MEIMAGRGISARAPTTLPADALRYMMIYKPRGFADRQSVGESAGSVLFRALGSSSGLVDVYHRSGEKGPEVSSWHWTEAVEDQREICGQPDLPGLGGADQGAGSISPSTQVQPVRG